MLSKPLRLVDTHKSLLRCPGRPKTASSTPFSPSLVAAKHMRDEEKIRNTVSGWFWRKSFGFRFSFWVTLKLMYSWVRMLFHFWHCPDTPDETHFQSRLMCLLETMLPAAKKGCSDEAFYWPCLECTNVPTRGYSHLISLHHWFVTDSVSNLNKYFTRGFFADSTNICSLGTKFETEICWKKTDMFRFLWNYSDIGFGSVSRTCLAAATGSVTMKKRESNCNIKKRVSLLI